MFYENLPCFNGSWSSTLNMNLRISSLSLIIKCGLNPKKHPIEYFPRSISFSNILWVRTLWLWHTHKGVESTKLIPIHVPNTVFLMKIVRESSIFFLQLYETIIENQIREQMLEIFTYIPVVIMLKTTETT